VVGCEEDVLLEGGRLDLVVLDQLVFTNHFNGELLPGVRQLGEKNLSE
jgi:hypothetical protein